MHSNQHIFAYTSICYTHTVCTNLRSDRFLGINLKITIGKGCNHLIRDESMRIYNYTILSTVPRPAKSLEDSRCYVSSVGVGVGVGGLGKESTYHGIQPAPDSF